MRIRLGVIASAVAMLSPAVLAQDNLSKTPATPSGACFEVIPAVINAVPYAPILVDRCDGRTWILTRGDLPDVKGHAGAFAFRWHPLINMENEAVLTFPEPPKPMPAPNINSGDIKKQLTPVR